MDIRERIRDVGLNWEKITIDQPEWIQSIKNSRVDELIENCHVFESIYNKLLERYQTRKLDKEMIDYANAAMGEIYFNLRNGVIPNFIKDLFITSDFEINCLNKFIMIIEKMSEYSSKEISIQLFCYRIIRYIQIS